MVCLGPRASEGRAGPQPHSAGPSHARPPAPEPPHGPGTSTCGSPERSEHSDRAKRQGGKGVWVQAT